MAIHLRPLPAAAIVVPIGTLVQRDDRSRIERVRQHLRGIVNNLRIGGGLCEERAWETLVEAFTREIARPLAREDDPLRAHDHILFIAAQLRRRVDAEIAVRDGQVAS